jgi:ABC-type Fe2+-enterobactin transport system substrate-binding protein
MTDRTIELCIDAGTLMALADASSNAELFKAIGYLSQWNLPLAKVRILGGVYDGNPEIIATYWRHAGNDPQPIAYQIGAVWHGDHFGFHS